MPIHFFSQAMGVLRAAQDIDQPARDGDENGEGQAARGKLEPRCPNHWTIMYLVP